ncbi:MAG: L-aspartate oxidase [Armatimonadetes bacterium]|nr:L-aspartate oxidase [Armatimonadota bacterium]MBS1711213.1 L-aspartate oxidase [Armatimonadota bacterium]MBX3108887.1 L-aspartate oxidase [Fimbriimonadaceae bacterium]
MKTHKTDFLAIGSGLAGLAFALKAAEHGQVTVLTKAQMQDSNTSWAQGGIAAAVGESDSWELHEQDTLIAGAGLCNPDAVRMLVQNAPAAIEWLAELGTRFDLSASNALDLGREGGHSRHRIVHHADKTGWEVERAVSEAVRKHPAIQVYENCFVTGLIVADGQCIGAEAIVNDLGPVQFAARATMLATGGCGKVYAHTTNPRVATGDGVALAHRAGAAIANMEFQQFHPTTLKHSQLSGFLITEAMRGAGATLRNHNGRRFMYDYDDRLELAPRDVVARSIEREIQKLKTWCVYLDPTHLDAADLQHEFPTIWNRLREIGIEIEKDWIPVVPAQHYSCGGVVTDLQGRTDIPRLYASGEVACTGVHGANRLASNSLLEAIVFSFAASQAVGHESPNLPASPAYRAPHCIPESDAIHIRHALQKQMSTHAGIFRTDAGLSSLRSFIAGALDDVAAPPSAPFSAYSAEAQNLLEVAALIVDGAASRKENVGLHYNADLA